MFNSNDPVVIVNPCDYNQDYDYDNDNEHNELDLSRGPSQMN